MASLRTHNHHARRRRAYRFSSLRTSLKALFAHEAHIRRLRGLAAEKPFMSPVIDQLVMLERYRAVETYSAFSTTILAEVVKAGRLSYEDMIKTFPNSLDLVERWPEHNSNIL